MSFPKDWDEAREAVRHVTDGHNKRLHDLEQAQIKLRMDFMKATADQTVALIQAQGRQTSELKDAISRVTYSIIKLTTVQTILFAMVILLFKYILKVF